MNQSHTASPWHGRNSRPLTEADRTERQALLRPLATKPDLTKEEDRFMGRAVPKLRVLATGTDADAAETADHLRDTEASNPTPPATTARTLPLPTQRSTKPSAKGQIDASNYRAGYRAGWRQGKHDRLVTGVWCVAFGMGIALALMAAGAKLG